jgi:propionyl-CoA carboxylase alpha chain
MSAALDGFVVDGINHNMPFLAALMRHPRWREGRLSTAFIAEEYPDGFAPVKPAPAEIEIIAAVALTAELLRKDRLDRFNDRMAPHSGAVRHDWVVRVDDAYVPVKLTDGYPGTPVEIDISIDGGGTRTIVSDWRPGETVWHGRIGEREVTAQLRPIPNGLKIDWQGLSATARVLTPRLAELDRLMPVKPPPDTSKMLLCPMPGLVVSIAVSAGQEVKAGETLAVIEAMKMENVLKAERDVVVGKVLAEPGSSLAVDAVIMEFA